MNPRPLFTAAEAVVRALALVGHGGVYQLGTGDIDTTAAGPFDCFGFAFDFCYGVPRHRQGFNRGPWATVSDDLNCNSAIEDSEHGNDLFDAVAVPIDGDMIMYPTIHLAGHAQPWIGHVKLVVSVERVNVWDPNKPDWSLLDTVECCGPNGRGPAVIAATGAGMLLHDHDWPKPEHCTRMLRVRP